MSRIKVLEEIEKQEKRLKIENIASISLFFVGVLFLFIPLIGWIIGLIMCISGLLGANSAHSKLKDLAIEKAKLYEEKDNVKRKKV